MDFWISVLRWLDTSMEEPALFGGYHLIWLGIVVVLSVALCLLRHRFSPKQICNFVLGVAIVVTALEIYKQINYSFRYDSGTVEFHYRWYIFPWQFCSTPMYVGLLAGIFRKGKVHEYLCAYLATYAVFAGLCVMLYPGDVFTETVGVNFQTMVCHGSMIVVGVFLMASGYVKLEHRTILKAMAVFVAALVVAMILNEIAYFAGLLENHKFNMFYISPHCPPHLPVYSLVQEALPYPLPLIIYVAAFSAAAYIILLTAMLVRKAARK